MAFSSLLGYVECVNASHRVAAVAVGGRAFGHRTVLLPRPVFRDSRHEMDDGLKQSLIILAYDSARRFPGSVCGFSRWLTSYTGLSQQERKLCGDSDLLS